MIKKNKSRIKFWAIVAAVAALTFFALVPIRGVNVYRGAAGTIAALRFDTESGGGAYAVYDVKRPLDSSKASLSDAIGARMVQTELFVRYADEGNTTRSGFGNASVSKQGSDRIRVEVPDASKFSPSLESLLELIERKLDLWFVDSSLNDVLEGKHIQNVRISANQTTQAYELVLELDAEGGELLTGVSGTYSIIDKAAKERGASEDSSVYNSYKITDVEIAAETSVTRRITVTSLSGTALNIAYYRLLAGARPLELTLAFADTVNSDAVGAAANLVFVGGGAAALFILAFLLLRYKGFGAFSAVSFLGYAAILLFALALLPFVKTSLAGLTAVPFGFILFAAAHIMVAERFGNGYAQGKTIQASAAAAYRKSLWPILDMHFVSIVAGGVLWILGEGGVTGFGIGVLCGAVASLFFSLVLTRYLFRLATESFGDKITPSFLGLTRPDGVKELGAEAENV